MLISTQSRTRQGGRGTDLEAILPYEHSKFTLLAGEQEVREREPWMGGWVGGWSR